MANGSSSVQVNVLESKTLTATFTSHGRGLPPNADEVGLITEIIGGSCTALTIKLQQLVGTQWVDLAGATGNSVIDVNAATTAEVNFASKASTGTLRVNASVVTLLDTNIIASAAIANATDTWTSAGHTYVDGSAVTLTTSDTVPAGLVAGTIYYVYAVDADTFKLCSTYANAIAHTVINITSDGVGNQTLTPIPLIVDSRIIYGKRG